MNAFMNFSNQHRQEVRDANPNAKVTEIAKILGSMWRNLSEEEKDRYREDYTSCSESDDEGYCGC